MLLWGGLVAGGVFALWGIVSSYRVLHPPARSLLLPSNLPPPATLSLRSLDGQQFDAWLFTPETPRGMILGCHGYSANHDQLLALAVELSRRHYAVMLFDLRGHGRRRGACTLGARDLHDLAALLEWRKRQPPLADLPLALIGFSMGGAIACQAARHWPDIRALVTDSVYARFFPVLANAIRERHHLPAIPWAWITWASVQAALGARLSWRDPVAVAPHCRQPLLLIHGAQDARVSVTDAGIVARHWRGPHEQWLHPTAAHVGTFAANPTDYCDRVTDFLDRWLAVAPRSSP